MKENYDELLKYIEYNYDLTRKEYIGEVNSSKFDHRDETGKLIITKVPAIICELWHKDIRWIYSFDMLDINVAREAVFKLLISNWHHGMINWEAKHREVILNKE